MSDIGKYYFATDGSYGIIEEGFVIADTSQWSITDWQEVEDAYDSERAFIVRGIASKYAND